MNFDVYCDESGNSGKNFLDSGQLMYVLAGIMFERNQSYTLRTVAYIHLRAHETLANLVCCLLLLIK
ncbi:DUF3800 domain-containing protein, partial [Bacillus sp. LR_6]|uniref:DUF3800 domain-containing protein n=1 Tax=Bacillus sp. LR_6 TaxID=3055785 RepID=UPI0035C18130